MKNAMQALTEVLATADRAQIGNVTQDHLQLDRYREGGISKQWHIT